ncbi:unnamed protein product [marine sediment metagenome]|uniref:Uncharacterized protein n=1 Tax=marine sediment metagenome TaxID=412755 RepID=X1DGY6_9ZZZZ
MFTNIFPIKIEINVLWGSSRSLIIDEYDKEIKLFEIIGDNTIIADAIISIDKINEILNTEIPVYEETIDNIIGILYSKDLLGIYFLPVKILMIKFDTQLKRTSMG